MWNRVLSVLGNTLLTFVGAEIDAAGRLSDKWSGMTEKVFAQARQWRASVDGWRAGLRHEVVGGWVHEQAVTAQLQIVRVEIELSPRYAGRFLYDGSRP